MSDDRPERLKTSAARIVILRKELETELKRRDQLVVEMYDDGYEQKTVKAWAGFKSPSSITRLLARPVYQPMIIDTEVRK